MPDSLTPIIEAPAELKTAILSALNIFPRSSARLRGITIKATKSDNSVEVVVSGVDGTAVGLAKDPFPTDKRWNTNDMARRWGELAKTASVKALSVYTGENLYWGSLEGVRPSNLWRLLRQRGFSNQETELILNSIYGVATEKTQLLKELYLKQEKMVFADNNSISLYIGIPFCPTRCAYCSFAAYPLKTHGHLKKPYLEALYYELAELRDYFAQRRVAIKSIYIGGGTPTALEAEELRQIFSLLPETEEFTVEAGRPDTIDRAKLLAMKEAKVDRISVNPQTLKESTLKLIGRKHTIEDFYKAVDLVREIGIPVMNIDLIAGLPGENAEDMDNSLERILALKPENVTVHTLAAKRASTWYKELDRWPLPSSLETEKMVVNAANKLNQAGLHPYYLYRQRHMAANLENVGYALEGQECYYNIVMIEELNTVVGAGAGASTRVVNQAIERIVNPKCPATYANRVTDLLKAKKNNLDRLFLM